MPTSNVLQQRSTQTQLNPNDYKKCSKPPVVCRGENVVDKFQLEQKYIQEKLYLIEPVPIEREEQMLQDAINYHICGFKLGADRVRDYIPYI